MKKGILFALGAIVPAYFLSIFTKLNFDKSSAIIFLLLIIYMVYRYRKILDFQIMIGLGKLPIIYAVLWRTKFGLKFMDKVATKWRESVKIIGYSFIGFGFFGMIFISVNIVIMLFKLFISPKEASEGVALVLPLTTIPGLGFLSFWHFLITLFITVLIHEFAHGIVARAHNVPVKSSGLGVFGIILPLFPLAFVEPSEKKMAKESDVVQYSIFAAGPMINIVFAFLIILLTSFVLVPIQDKITHPIGFSFNGVMDNYSAQEVGMDPGTIIDHVDGVEVLTYQDFSAQIGSLKVGQGLQLSGPNGTFNVVTKASPNDDTIGYIGILDIENEVRINDNMSWFGGIFFWIRGLVKWMYILNLIIGLMNLLPLMITDGGRMLKTALESIAPKRAHKIWTTIGAVFIFTLLAALIIRYTLQFFSYMGLG